MKQKKVLFIYNPNDEEYNNVCVKFLESLYNTNKFELDIKQTNDPLVVGNKFSELTHNIDIVVSNTHNPLLRGFCDKNNILIAPNTNTVKLTTNKQELNSTLNQNNINTPNTICLQDTEHLRLEYNSLIKELGEPFLLKYSPKKSYNYKEPITKTYKIFSIDDFLTIFNTEFAQIDYKKEDWVAQKYIQTKNNITYKVLMVEDDIIKISNYNHNTNINNGDLDDIDLEKYKQITKFIKSSKIYKKLDTDIVEFDVLEGQDNNFYIVDANTIPNFDVEKLNQKDIELLVDTMVDAIKKESSKLNWRKKKNNSYSFNR